MFQPGPRWSRRTLSTLVARLGYFASVSHQGWKPGVSVQGREIRIPLDVLWHARRHRRIDGSIQQRDRFVRPISEARQRTKVVEKRLDVAVISQRSPHGVA